jgi:hypothetical protein
MNSVTDRCPWCGTLISRDKFKEVETKIREEERKKLAEAEAVMRKRVEAERQVIERRAKEAADERIAKITAELNATLAQLRQAEASKAKIREQAQKEAEEKAKQASEEDLKRQRQVLENDREQKLLRQLSEFNREREGYHKKINELGRQLQQKTAQETADGNEIDLFEELRTAFPQDQITRLHEGKPNEKILHEILYKDRVCGCIVIDSRNRQSWQHGFVSKLRSDQLERTADHAVFSTTVFPKGKKELCIEEDVIVVHPGRAVHIVELLRNALVRMYVQGLSVVDRTAKNSRLYEYISSKAYAQKFNEATSLTNNIGELDVQEVKQHQKTWEKRGLLTQQLKALLNEMDVDIGTILEGYSESEVQTDETLSSKSHLRRIS